MLPARHLFEPNSLYVLSSAVKKLIDSKYFFCKSSVRFIPIDQACDGTKDCWGGEDEITCVSSFKVNTTFPGKVKHVTLFHCVIMQTKASSGKANSDSSPLHPSCSASHLGSTRPAGAQPRRRLEECVWGRLDPATHHKGVQAAGIHSVSLTAAVAEKIMCCLACLS